MHGGLWGIDWVVEDALVFIQGIDLCHVGVGEFKVKDVCILLDPRCRVGLWKWHKARLETPSDEDLRDALADALCDVEECWILEAFAARQRAVRLDDDVAGRAKLCNLALSAEWVQLNLIDAWLHTSQGLELT